MFNLFDGSRQREEYGRRPPTTPSCHPPTTSPPRSPDTEPPTITHASECKLPEAVNHFEKIPDSPRAPSLRVCLAMPLFLSFTPLYFLSSSSASYPRLAIVSIFVPRYVSHRTLPEKRQAAPIDGRGMCSGPYSHLARPGPRQ